MVKEASIGSLVLLPTSGGKFLLQQNGKTDFNPGKLRPPGGHAESKDADAKATIIRELKEEFDLDVKADDLTFLGYEYRKPFWGNSIFRLEKHGLKPGTYQASNSPDEKIKLVEADMDDPDYVGPLPHKLITEEAKLEGDKVGMGDAVNKKATLTQTRAPWDSVPVFSLLKSAAQPSNQLSLGDYGKLDAPYFRQPRRPMYDPVARFDPDHDASKGWLPTPDPSWAYHPPTGQFYNGMLNSFNSDMPGKDGKSLWIGKDRPAWLDQFKQDLAPEHRVQSWTPSGIPTTSTAPAPTTGLTPTTAVAQPPPAAPVTSTPPTAPAAVPTMAAPPPVAAPSPAVPSQPATPSRQVASPEDQRAQISQALGGGSDAQNIAADIAAGKGFDRTKYPNFKSAHMNSTQNLNRVLLKIQMEKSAINGLPNAPAPTTPGVTLPPAGDPMVPSFRSRVGAGAKSMWGKVPKSPLAVGAVGLGTTLAGTTLGRMTGRRAGAEEAATTLDNTSWWEKIMAAIQSLFDNKFYQNKVKTASALPILVIGISGHAKLAKRR